MTATILVVDDDPDLELLVSHKVCRQIRDGEYNFLFAGDGEEALSTLKEGPVHAIFSAPKEQADHATLAVACAMEMDEISPWTAAVHEKAALP